MIYETRINLRNKTKEELILLVNEGLQTIQKYEKELEKYKMMLAKTQANFLNSDLRTKRKNDEDLLMLNEGWKTELKKKEKTIKNMAKKLNQAYFEEDKFCQWFEKEVVQVQKKEDYGYVADLIKEYFERKVEK